MHRPMRSDIMRYSLTKIRCEPLPWWTASLGLMTVWMWG